MSRFFPSLRSSPIEDHQKIRYLCLLILDRITEIDQDYPDRNARTETIHRIAEELNLDHLTVPELYPILMRTIDRYPDILKVFTEDEEPTPVFAADFTAGHIIPYIQAIPYA